MKRYLTAIGILLTSAAVIAGVTYVIIAIKRKKKSYTDVDVDVDTFYDDLCGY